ncbi:MAG TPA: hypothetical protein VK927_02825, partial [Adhaeribacter sp.]|nr:hypothetical protein [Adhaeribacter sp.]
MNKASFLSIVRETSRISEQDAEALEQLVVNFPYCQTAHLLIAKAAYDRGSMLSNQKLKKAAIYATNRQLLKKLIYTSDATVALHPLPPEETVAEMPEKVSAPKPEERLPIAEATQTASETTASEPEIAQAKSKPEKEAAETEPSASV